MRFSSVCSVYCLLLIVVCVHTQSTIKDISLKGYYKCSLHPSNQLRLELFVYDVNAHATRLNAIDAEEVEITSCVISGSGNIVSPFYVTSKINMNDDSEMINSCGMTKTTVNGQRIYNWRVKAYSYPIEYYPNNIGFILTLQCNPNDLTDGRVETLVDINVNSLSVFPENLIDLTGVNTIARNANIYYVANLYPDGRLTSTELKDAKGFALYNCFAKTNPADSTGGQKFIDANGCAVSGAAFAPTTSFRQVTNTGNHIKLEAKFSTAVLLDNRDTIYFECAVRKCTAINDPCCLDYCSASINNDLCPSSVNTGVTYSTSFNVQQQRALQLFPASTTGTTALTSVNSGNNIRITAVTVPSGIDGGSDLRDAKGFYLYSCIYSTNAAMTNPTTFIDANGCLVPNTELTPVSDFEADDTLSSPDSKFVLSTGQIIVRKVGNAVYRVRCNTGKCTVAGHNFCKKRCRATDNNVSGSAKLGYIGHSFTLSVLDVVNVPALNMNLQGPNGQALSRTSAPVTIGNNVNFGAEVTPGGTGPASAAFVNAKGIFLHSCYATQNNQRRMFIDEKGCSVAGSPYETSENCKDVTEVDGVPPFKIDCGTFTVPDTGDVEQTCNISICTTENNKFCENRCAAGEIQADSNVVNPNLSTTAAFRTQDTTRPRTAVKSEELRNTIAAVSVVLAALILLGVTVGTCIIVNKQKSLAKRKLDGRRYNYY